MLAQADLEITLQRLDDSAYSAELRYQHPAANVDTSASAVISFDRDALELSLDLDDPAAYGLALRDALLKDDLLVQFEQARAVAESGTTELRVRLRVGDTAPALHDLLWETLQDPAGRLLATGERVIFSRYLSSRSWTPVRPRARTPLRTLLAVAAPADVQAKYQLAPVLADEERTRAADALTGPADPGAVPIELIDLHAAGKRTTLANLGAALRHGCDILYLVCHGGYSAGTPRLYLEDDQGRTDDVAADGLLHLVANLPERPRLVVLVSCESAGPNSPGLSFADGAKSLLALGPRLVSAGVPAVLAMNGKISMETMKGFMPVFLAALRETGAVDVAVARARQHVGARGDWWMPVLFSRLRAGTLWYEPHFADEMRGGASKKWPGLIQSLKKGTCTPILGPDLTEPLFGPRNEIAGRLAREHHFPLAPPEQTGLPQVAQFLAATVDRSFLPDRLAELLEEGIAARNDPIPPEIKQIADGAERLGKLMSLAWEQRSRQIKAEPHSVLADLKLKLYVTADQSNLLETALSARQRTPITLVCPWKASIAEEESLWKLTAEPTVQAPLVYHLFGSVAHPQTLVLSEDDCFDFLIGVTRYGDSVPPLVRAALVNTRSILLGFRPDDWYYRIFLRFLMNLGGSEQRASHAHVAAQITPDESEVLDLVSARSYLEEFFVKRQISIYWGSVEDFMLELQQKLGGGP